MSVVAELFPEKLENLPSRMVVRQQARSPKQRLLFGVLPKRQGFGEAAGSGTEFLGFGLSDIMIKKSLDIMNRFTPFVSWGKIRRYDVTNCTIMSKTFLAGCGYIDGERAMLIVKIGDVWDDIQMIKVFHYEEPP